MPRMPAVIRWLWTCCWSYGAGGVPPVGGVGTCDMDSLLLPCGVSGPMCKSCDTVSGAPDALGPRVAEVEHRDDAGSRMRTRLRHLMTGALCYLARRKSPG